MKLLVDFLAVTRGGGLQNAKNFWRTVSTSGGGHEWLAVTQPGTGLEELTTAHHQDIAIWPVSGFAHRLFLENGRLPALAARAGADVVLTPMGAGPLRGKLPRVIGWHDSSLAYPESELWTRTSRRFRAFEWGRQRYVARAARTATHICVQTDTMARRLSRVWGIERARFRIVPNGPSAFLASEPRAPAGTTARPLQILVIGDAKPTKNLEVVPYVARALESMDLPSWEIVMTIPEAEGEWLGPFSRALSEVPEAHNRIRRIGTVPHEQLGALYRASSAVLLPSFLESFSATYVEAMHFGVPLVTSDMDFARDICQGAARYADPFDAEALAGELALVLRDRDEAARLRREGTRVLAGLPDWNRRLGLYTAACQEAVALKADAGRAVLQPGRVR